MGIDIASMSIFGINFEEINKDITSSTSNSNNDSSDEKIMKSSSENLFVSNSKDLPAQFPTEQMVFYFNSILYV
jgi:hypothetical protein